MVYTRTAECPLNQSCEAGKGPASSILILWLFEPISLPADYREHWLSTKLLGTDEIRRALTRIAHEVLERNRGSTDIVFVGLHTRGVPLALRISALISEFEHLDPPPVGSLDIGLYRDDVSVTQHQMRPTDLPMVIDDRLIILVDDVLFTGRSIRAAMDALNDFGRPRQIQLAVLIDRGHRELPIRADYIGKNVPTSIEEEVLVNLKETDDTDEVRLAKRGVS